MATQFIVEGILPAGYVHLIAGPVGMGKTTLIIQLIEALRDEGEWLGGRARRTSVLYIAADRSKRETRETVERMGSKVEFEIHTLIDARMSRQAMPPLRELIQRHAKAGQLIIVEPLDHFFTGNNAHSKQQVGDYLADIAIAAIDAGVTILGSMHSPKMKPNDRYLLPRERVSGVVSWTAFTSSLILIEPENPKDPTDPFRTVTIELRNGKPSVRPCKVSDLGGRIEPFVVAADPEDRIEAFRGWIEFREEVTAKECENWAEGRGIVDRTVYRWLKKLQEADKIIKTKEGTYRTGIKDDQK